MANQMTKKPSENTYIGLGLSLGMVFGLTVASCCSTMRRWGLPWA